MRSHLSPLDPSGQAHYVGRHDQESLSDGYFVRATGTLALLLLTAGLTRGQVMRSDVQAHDVYYSSTTNLLYVTAASTSPHAPNKLLALNPVTAQDVWQIDAGGTDPGEIAGSDDGNYVYVYLQSAALIRRFNLQTQTADLQFPATMTGAPSQVAVSCMKVIQGDPDTVAVSFVNPASDPGHVGIALFHLGTQLPNTVPGSTHCLTMAYGAAPATMWCHDSEDTAFTLYQLSVDASGIQTVGPGLPGLVYGFNQTPQFYNGRLFFNSLGLIIDPVQRLDVAQLPYVGTPTGAFTVDPNAGLVYFSRANGSERYFWALDANRFLPVAYADTGTAANPWIYSNMVRCGTGGLAGISESGSVAVVPLSVIAPLPLVVPGTPTNDPSGAIRMAMPNQSLAYSPVLNMLYATVPDAAPGLGNSIVPLDPNSLNASSPLWIGSRPSLSAVTQDGLHLYEALGASNVLWRINLAAFTPDLDFALYNTGGFPVWAMSLVPLPASPNDVAVLQGGGAGALGNTVAVYDRGVALPQAAAAGWDTVLALSDNGTTLYGLNGFSTSPGFDSYAITAQGVSNPSGALSVTPQLFSDLKCRNGLCVTSYGIVIDAVRNRALGVCPISGFATPLLDVPGQRAYFLIAGTNNINITSCNLNTYLPAEQFTLTAQPQFSGNLLLTQPDQFAFNTGSEVITLPKSAVTPVPATPAPQPTTSNGLVQLPVAANYGVYDPVRDRLYVQLAYNNAGTLGNSIGIVRADTGALVSTIPLGGEPVMMALSSDASRLFVALNYADAVLQVNMSTQTVEQTILLGSAVSALCAIPGQSTSVVVADQNTLHAFDNGVERPLTAQSGSLLPAAAITFGPTPSAFYSLAPGGVAAWQVNSSGITAVNSVFPNNPYIGTARTMTSIGNNLYIDGGSVFSIPSLAWVNQIADAGSVAADPVTQQIYVAWNNGISIYSAATLALTGWLGTTTAQHRPLIPCGPQHIAWLEANINFGSLSAVTLPHLPASVSPGNDGIMRLDVPVSSVVWDTLANQLVAAALPGAGPDGNSLFSLDPFFGALQIVTRIDNQPSQISLAPDAHVAYVGASGGGTVARINLDSSAIEKSWTFFVQDPNGGALVPYQLVALSAATDSLIVNASSRYKNDAPNFLMAIDSGLPRTSILGLWPNPFYGSIIAADGTGQYVYVEANAWLNVDANGIAIAQDPSITGLRSFSQAAACGNLLYLNSGQVVNPAAGQIVADYGNRAQPYPGPSDRIACDAANDRVLYLTSTEEDYFVQVFQLSTGASQGKMRFGNVSGNILDLIAAGPSLAAIRTDQSVLLLPLGLVAGLQTPPSVASVTNAASYAQSGFAPGSIAAIFGSGLANWTFQANSFPLPGTLAGTSVSVAGQPAYPLYVSPNQINVVLPTSLPAGTADLQVSVGTLSTNTSISIVPTAPGIFTYNGNHAAAQNQDYSLNSPTNPAPAGSVIMVYFTGQGLTTLPVSPWLPAPGADNAVAMSTATVGGQAAQVLYSGLAPGFAGLAQANIQLPSLASGDYQLVLKVGDALSNSVVVSVK